MKHCKHCNDTLFTEIYDTCMTCFEKQPTESTMTKTIKQYQQDCLWYQREIKRLESCCSNLQGVAKGDAYNIKRLSEENERLVKIYNDQKNILHEILHELPVGNITTHTYENIPERVAYYVKENAKCEKEVTDALLATWVAEESLEVLEESIKAYYEYYAGFAANKNLTSFQMLDTLFKSKPVYNRVDTKENTHLVNDNRKLHGELAKCIKDSENIENERDECKKLAVEQYLHIEELDKENENNFQLIAKLIEERDRYQEDTVRLLARLGTTQERMIDAERERDKLKCERNLWKAEESAHYKAALEEIVKRPRRSETCKLIAQKALGRLNDEEYQPELLIEENLALKMKIEDLQTVINEQILNKVFHEKVNPLTCCPDCGEYWDYHHEQHCKVNCLPPSQNNDA